MLGRLQTLPLCFALIAALNGCGNDRSVKASKSLDSGTADVPCTQASCPKINLSITASPMQNGRLMGSIANKVQWIILGTATSTTRDIRMKALNPPVGGDFVPGTTPLSIEARYNSQEAVEGQAPIVAIIRDVSQCKHDRPANISACESLDQTGYEAFETKAEFPWSIVIGDLNQLADPSFTQNQSIPIGANSGMSGCVQGFLPGALQGVMTGNILGGVIGGTVGCMGNTLGNLGK